MSFRAGELFAEDDVPPWHPQLRRGAAREVLPRDPPPSGEEFEVGGLGGKVAERTFVPQAITQFTNLLKLRRCNVRLDIVLYILCRFRSLTMSTLLT